MNILFISLLDFSSLEESNIYTDLLYCMREDGHKIYVISPVEKRTGKQSHVVNDGETIISKPRIGNIQKTGFFEKGISTLMLSSDLRRAVKREFAAVRFDLVLYPTPPITFLDTVKYVKRRDGAKTYLMLKDIFPQNAVDIGLMSTKGPKSVVWRYFRQQEQELYRVSDYIGCMSPANVQYVLHHNPELSPEKVGLCPNSVIPRDLSCDEETRIRLRSKYGIPLDKKVFVYGGNLGKPQDIPFIIECLKSQSSNKGVFFLIVGDGTEYGLLEKYFHEEQPEHAKLLRHLPKEEYDQLVGCCDVGMIFLDSRFTIPNYPSRLLSYQQAKIPVLCVTDKMTDIGLIAESKGYGIASLSDSKDLFSHAIEQMQNADTYSMGEMGWQYLCEHESSNLVAQSIISSIGRINNKG